MFTSMKCTILIKFFKEPLFRTIIGVLPHLNLVTTEGEGSLPSRNLGSYMIWLAVISGLEECLGICGAEMIESPI